MRSRRATALTVILLLLGLALPGGSPAASGSSARGCRQGYVALTFDDGPSATTAAILRELRDNGHARVTFFNIGAKEQRAPDLVRAEQEAGHATGDHTYSHPFLDQLRPGAAYNEILGTQQIHGEITGIHESLFRPPFGRTTPAIRAAAASLGMTEVLWTVDTLDYQPTTTAADIARIAASARAGDIVLLHDDGYRTTVKALPAILRDLARRGLCPGRVTASRWPVTAWPGMTFYAKAAGW